jgi:predicted nuclease of restriction endonuclease-like (RecB) superfamily
MKRNTMPRDAKTPKSKKTASKGKAGLDFSHLAKTISQVDTALRGAAAASVNRMLTMRNWLIGMYIVEYEQNGSDRAKYGEALLRSLVERLKSEGIKGMSFTNLNLFRQFYRTYPQIIQEAAELFRITDLNELKLPIIQKPSEQLVLPPIWQKPSAKLHNEITNQAVTDISPSPEKLIRHFSFSHFVELMRISDPLKRAFYEIEGIKGCWSVPQLKRQIESLLYERTGLSKDKAGLVDAAQKENVPATIDDMIRDPYILEFAGLPERFQYSEIQLETALLDHIQSFLLELGNGFCFEARQKRITLDNEHDRIDLVFYHRILRCHVLIDLKVRKFTHGDAGQMNFYLNYYRENEMAEGDNPPVGLILCTDRNETRVKYAIAGIDNQLFVSKYLTALPSEEKLLEFLRNDRDRTENVLRELQMPYGEKYE